MKKTDKDKAGISSGTIKIEPMGHKQGNPAEFDSTKKSQKPKAGGTHSVSRNQKIRC